MRGEQYLRKPRQYSLVYSKGSTRTSPLLVMKALPNNLVLTRYGFSVSKRVGTAVTRNRVKRLLREIMRQAPLKPGWDIVLIARPPVAATSYAHLRKALEDTLGRAHLLERSNEGVGAKVD